MCLTKMFLKIFHPSGNLLLHEITLISRVLQLARRTSDEASPLRSEQPCSLRRRMKRENKLAARSEAEGRSGFSCSTSPVSAKHNGGKKMTREGHLKQTNDGSSEKQKILLVIGDAAEVTDTLYPWMRLQEAGYQAVVAAPEVRKYSLVQHEQPEGWDITREGPGYQMQSDIAFRDINPDEYAGLLVSGGRAPEYIRYCEHLIHVVRWLVEAGRPVGSICHGIEVLATAGVIKGKQITTIAKCRFDAEVCGATYIDAPVMVDGNIITARGARDGWQWMREYLKVLERV